MSALTPLLYVVGVLIFLGAIFVSIALHELGHLHYAKKFGCRVSQYMVGFGPTIWSRTKDETEYGIKLIPLGGYVKIIGMFPPESEEEQLTAKGQGLRVAEKQALREQQAQDSTADGDVLIDAGTVESTEDTTPQTLRLRRSNTGLFAQLVSQTRAAEFELVEPQDADRLFYKLPASKKVLVMLAGPAVNIAIAFVCFLVVYGVHGIHTQEPTGRPVVASVSDCVIPESDNRSVCEEGDPISPARAAGLAAGDEILSFNGQDITDWGHLSGLIHANEAGPMQLVVLRDDEQVQLQQAYTVLLERDLEGNGQTQIVGFLGASPESHEIVTRHGPIFTMSRMGEMTAHAVSSVVALPGRVWNVGAAVAGLEDRNQEGPMSVIGGSRIAGEVASSEVAGLDVSNKAALLGLVVGSFNLFIGVFNLIPLLPLDGGHIAGAAFEGLRRQLAKVFRRPDPGHVNVAAQLPLAYCLGFALLAMSLVLMIGDVIVPLRSGL